MIEIEPKRDEKGNIVKGVWIRKGITETITEFQLDLEIVRIEKTIQELQARLNFLKSIKSEIEKQKTNLKLKTA